MNRLAPTASPSMALTTQETNLLDMLIEDVNGKRPRNLLLSTYLTKIARLGGYLGRAKDRPPGNLVMWRGLSRLTDIEFGFALATRLVGN